MSATMIGRIVVKNTTYEVEFSEYTEKFSATVGHERVQAASWNALKSAIAKATRKQSVRVEVPFMNPSGRKGIAVGVHAGNGNVLVRWDGRDKVEQLSTAIYPLVPETNVETLKGLIKAKNDAEATLNEFLADHRLGNTGRYSNPSLKDVVLRVMAEESERRAAQEATKDGAVDLDKES